MPKRTTGDRPELKPFNVGAAAIDIGSKLHMAAVAPTSTDTPVRAFGTFTQDLHDLADWFKACGVTSVAMESTGVYWIPAYEILEQRGFEVILVNARYAKNVPGRKTDVSDAAWLRQLHSYGLLRGSFRPDAEIATLRAYLRQRERLVEYAAAHIQHMQKALMEMNLQLHHVVHHRCDRDADHPSDCRGRAQSRRVGDLPRCALPFLHRDDPRRAGGQRSRRTYLRPDPVAGALRHLPGQDARLRSQARILDSGVD